jgi:hypothetical protein
VRDGRYVVSQPAEVALALLLAHSSSTLAGLSPGTQLETISLHSHLRFCTLTSTLDA